MSAAHVEKLKDEGTKIQVVVSGGVAGLVSRFCIAPLDVVKIRLQLQPHTTLPSAATLPSSTIPTTSPSPLIPQQPTPTALETPTYRGVFSTLTTIARNEGLRALWKGNIPAEALYVCYGGIQFASYRSLTQLQSHLLSPTNSRLPSALESFVSGAGAGAIATAATYPLDLLRTRFAAQGNTRIYTGLLGSISHIRLHEGYRGYFRGLSAALAQIVPYMGLFFTSYEAYHSLLAARTNLPFGSGDGVAGILASVTSKTFVFPLDLVRKRLQVQGPTRTLYVHRNIPEYTGVLTALGAIWRAEGWRGWYRGLTVSLVKAAPASAVTMWTYERVLHSLMTTSTADEIWELNCPADGNDIEDDHWDDEW